MCLDIKELGPDHPVILLRARIAALLNEAEHHVALSALLDLFARVASMHPCCTAAAAHSCLQVANYLQIKAAPEGPAAEADTTDDARSVRAFH